ncbi:MAG TPA: hypothetical protein VHG91_18480 [Longimicrobium sp.]|nr:hypothetical protein [Longimicrobium sp.]
MRRLLVAGTVVLAGCTATSAPTNTPNAGLPVMQQTDTGAEVRLTGEAVASNDVLPGVAIDKVYSTLPTVYNELGIPLNLLDPATRQAGNTRLVLRNRHFGDANSRYVNCGVSRTAQRAADAYRVQLSVRTTVEAAEGGSATRVSTLVEGFARANEGSSITPVRCVSTGVLESRIAQLLKLRTALQG